MTDLGIAYDEYRDRLYEAVVAQSIAAHGRRSVRSPRLCRAPWPPSLADVAPSACQLPTGHHSRHRHRPPGGTAAIEWR